MDDKHILLVEDDAELAELIQDYLISEQFSISWVDNGNDAIVRIINEQPDLVILDYMLPGVNGLEVCKHVISQYTGPILMLTAKDDEMIEIASLNLGALGFLKKPVRPHILLAHIKAHLRSAAQHAAVRSEPSPPLLVQNLLIDQNAFRATLSGNEITLTSAEFELLALLGRHAGKPLSRDEISQSLRGLEYDGLDRTIDMRISSLRRKLGDEYPPYKYVKTVRGKGYLLATG